jgi:chemotaxis protein CheX
MTALAHADLSDVIDQVWSSFVGEDQPLLPRLVPAGTPFDTGDTWSATVTISDGWHGSVTVELSHRVALQLTRTMLFLTEADDIADADVADAVGELVNMIGGNVKSLMPGPSRLSLPAVSAGRAVLPSDAAEVARLDGQWAGEPVRVTVHSAGFDSNVEVPS